MNPLLARSWEGLTHWWGRLTGRYYFEDFVRVYPEGVVFSRFGRRRAASHNDLRNFLNHQKFYRFAAQFADRATVADIGCGSGHGCEILKAAGAAAVFGCDMSKTAIAFARRRYGYLAEFAVQGITELSRYQDSSFDLSVSSEVLEHIKEYGKERVAIEELKRITKVGGLVVIGTPNSELLGDHGFYFDEIDRLFSSAFARYVIFENALVPTGAGKARWERRLAERRHGVIVTQSIDFAETVTWGAEVPGLKKGLDPGTYRLGNLDINTKLLHDTHSWIVLAVKE
jgi:SAM-dependent methyltransferase